MKRTLYVDLIRNEFRIHPITGLLGPRQVGKTTLALQFAKEILEEKVHFLDAENPLHFDLLQQPLTTLPTLEGLIVIDEVQLCPHLFPALRILVDEKPRQFLLLGSASPLLLQHSAETLAGRIGYIELPPFSLWETHHVQQLWLRGGFPRSYLAQTDQDSYHWRQNYVRTFLERDIPSLGIKIPALQLRRFWMMLAHYHGQLMNFADLGRSLGISAHTIKHYLDILNNTLMIRILSPWYVNIGKRQVKTPKIYFKDSGILNFLLGISSWESLLNNPKLGSLWEGFALEEIIRYFRAAPEECYFWRTQAGAELDLLLLKEGKKIGFEFKYADAPKITSSMRNVLEELELDHLYIVHPGKEKFALGEHITLCGLESFL